MVVMKKHAQAILKLWKEGELIPDESEKETFFQLELSGLTRPVGVDVYGLTFSGSMIAEVLSNLIDEGLESPESWDESFRWLGSEIISMIRYSKQAQSVTREEISRELEKRGFSKEGRLTSYAYAIDDAYLETHPRLLITSKVAEELRKMPPGPGKKSALSIGGDEILRLESMRMIAFSVPKSDVFALTGLGQQIRFALLKGLVVTDELVLDELVLDTVAKAYEGRKLSDSEMESLMERGIMGFSGELLPAADHLYLAWKIFRKGPYLATPAFQISDEEVKVLTTVKKLWEKHETNPEIVPTDSQVKEEMEKEWNLKDYSPKLALMNLEGFGLLKSVSFQRGNKEVLVYNFTSHGEEVLKDREGKGGISAVAVKSITMTKKEFAAPNLKWYEIAVEEGLISQSSPTKSGVLFSRLSVEAERRPLITKVEAKVLKKIPFTRGVFIDEISLSEEERMALDMLEAKNLVEILPTDLVVLTKAGQYMKKAIAGVPDGIGTPVTPILVRLLQAIRKVGGLHVKENRIRIKPENWKMIEKEVGVDPETFNDALLLAKNCKYVGKDSLTEAGRYLLSAIDELSKGEYEWVEF